jgi:hypothetical protein
MALSRRLCIAGIAAAILLCTVHAQHPPVRFQWVQQPSTSGVAGVPWARQPVLMLVRNTNDESDGLEDISYSTGFWYGVRWRCVCIERVAASQRRCGLSVPGGVGACASGARARVDAQVLVLLPTH